MGGALCAFFCVFMLTYTFLFHLYLTEPISIRLFDYTKTAAWYQGAWQAYENF